MGTNRERDRPPLEQRVCRAIRLLADGWAVDEVARAVKVRPATLRAWQDSEDFRDLLECLNDAGQIRESLDTLGDLTPGAILALRRALEGDDVRIAVQAAREVLDRVGLIRRKGLVSQQQIEQSSEHVIRVEYVNPDGQTVSTSPWADRNPAAPGTLQSGSVWEALREDGDGEDPAGGARAVG
jgi:hypothetical protein